MLNRLHPGEKLRPGDQLTSKNGKFILVLQGDGNLVLYPNVTEAKALWANGTAGHTVSEAILQEDGNFVLYNVDGQALWNSGTHGHEISFIILQDDGNVAIYDTDGKILWTTDTVMDDRLFPGQELHPGDRLFPKIESFFLYNKEMAILFYIPM